MQTVTSKDGTKIAFDKVGSGPAVILVSGATAYRASDTFMTQMSELLSEHFTVYTYDRRGRGESGDTQPFTKEREIEDLQALVEDAGGRAMVFGISSGAVLVLDTAAVTAGISKVVVYEPPLIVDDSRQPVPDDYAEHLMRLGMAFEELFFGHYSSHLVVMPMANLVPSWINGVGVGNKQETYAVCCLKSAELYSANPLRIFDLAQHEASHPVLAEIQQHYPGVPDACAFVEEVFPPTGKFA